MGKAPIIPLRSAALLALCLAGCEKSPPRSVGIAFLKDGVTPQQEVRGQLGAPSLDADDGHVLTYRLERTKDGFAISTRPNKVGWEDATHSLVLIFGTDGVLQRHALVPVKGD